MFDDSKKSRQAAKYEWSRIQNSRKNIFLVYQLQSFRYIISLSYRGHFLS